MKTGDCIEKTCDGIEVEDALRDWENKSCANAKEEAERRQMIEWLERLVRVNAMNEWRNCR